MACRMRWVTQDEPEGVFLASQRPHKPAHFSVQNRVRTTPHNGLKPHKSAQVFLHPIALGCRSGLDFTMVLVYSHVYGK
jgi:hypothetical protein